MSTLGDHGDHHVYMVSIMVPIMVPYTGEDTSMDTPSLLIVHHHDHGDHPKVHNGLLPVIGTRVPTRATSTEWL